MLGLLLNPKRILYILGAVILAGFVWYAGNFVSDKYAAERAVAELTQTIAVMNIQAAQKENALKVAESARTVLENLKNGYDDIRLSIAETAPEDDGAIAPVLRRTLDSLGGMRP